MNAGRPPPSRHASGTPRNRVTARQSPLPARMPKAAAQSAASSNASDPWLDLIQRPRLRIARSYQRERNTGSRRLRAGQAWAGHQLFGARRVSIIHTHVLQEDDAAEQPHIGPASLEGNSSSPALELPSGVASAHRDAGGIPARAFYHLLNVTETPHEASGLLYHREKLVACYQSFPEGLNRGKNTEIISHPRGLPHVA